MPSRIRILMHKLKSDIPNDHLRTALGEIRLLSSVNDDNRITIAKAGAIPLLTNLLTVPDSQIQEHAVIALRNLSISDKNKGIIVSSGALPGIVHVLKEGSMEARENATAILSGLSEFEKNQLEIGDVGAIPPLLLILYKGTPKGKKDAAHALYHLCLYLDNRIRAVSAGVVPVLLDLPKEAWSEMHNDLMSILALISIEPEGIFAIDEAEAIPFLVEVIKSGPLLSEYTAVRILVRLCSADRKYLVEIQEDGLVRKLKQMAKHGSYFESIDAQKLLNMVGQ
ncbi:hypothetical protein L2E82_29998 [Cichorium intybus]|uniref:Uncharacterized protein n=1 Tax=Cichorium intybus TaxID=13427 RepID=A0ACB9CZ60_CICIN|nr:hypothetical protein L2E82_29998 [Cichorium intybus]